MTMKKKTKTTKTAQGDPLRYLAVLMEDMRDDIKLLAEGQMALNERFGRLEAKVDNLEIKVDRLEAKFDNLEIRVDSLETKLDAVDNKIDTQIGLLRTEMNEKFQLVFEYLSRIEDEIVELRAELKRVDREKVSREEFEQFVRRLEKVERELERQKVRLEEKYKTARNR